MTHLTPLVTKTYWVTHNLSKLGLRDTPLKWFTLYLSDRSYRVTVNGKLSKKFKLNCGVPQCSCLGPLLFNIYASGIFEIVQKHLVPDIHCYGDDSKLYFALNPDSNESQERTAQAMESCLVDIKKFS